MEKRSKYSCEAHIDEAIDDFIVDYETFPNLNATNYKKCDYCDEKAIYELN